MPVAVGDLEIPLSVSGLDVTIEQGSGVLPVLQGVDLEVAAGQIVGLVGESGSGKSVFCLASMGLLPERWHTAGTIAVNGRVITGPDKRAIEDARGREAAMIFQDASASLNPIAKIGGQLVETIRRLRGTGTREATEIALELLEHVGIPEPRRRFNEYPFQLSGGQNQRVLIALALAGRPRLLFADEPTTALDVTVQAQILELIGRLRDETNMGVVFVSHDLGVIANICDEIAVMYAGRIIEYGPTDAILHEATHPYTQGLVKSMPTKRGGRLYSIGGRVPQPGERPAGCAFAPRCPRKLDRCVKDLPILLEGDIGRTLRACHNPVAAAIEMAAEHDAAPVARFPEEETLLQLAGATCDYRISAGGSIFGGHRLFRAVDRIDLSVSAGEAVALIGESGSGKSTVAKLCLGVETSSQGAVMFDGRPVPPIGSAEHRAFTRHVQLVPQSPFLATDPRMRIGEQIREPLDIHRKGSAVERAVRVEELMETVGLSGYLAQRFPHEVSGGQLQRVVIARALALEPRLLICDEPTSALDVSVQGQIIELLKTLRSERRLSLLFITHDLRIIRSLCDRVAVMNAGQIVEYANIEDVFERPSHPYTRDLLAAAPDFTTLTEPTVENLSEPVS